MKVAFARSLRLILPFAVRVRAVATRGVDTRGVRTAATRGAVLLARVAVPLERDDPEL